MKLFPLHILPNDTKIDFMRWRHVAMAVTIVVFLASVAIIGIKGFNYALDFTGGTLIEARFDKAVDVEQVRTKLGATTIADVAQREAQQAGAAMYYI